MKDENRKLRAVVVLHEGVPGHRNQSLGIAEALQKEQDILIREFQVPNFNGLERYLKVKKKIKKLPKLSQLELGKWLESADGTSIFTELHNWMEKMNIQGSELLIISAGSRVAPYTYSLSRLLECISITLMTPKYLGTEPFDFSIVPIHDQIEERANQLVTLGAPNRVRPEAIEQAAIELQKEFSKKSRKAWAILIGGESSTFRIPPKWIRPTLEPILQKAQEQEVDLYIATSRRTRRDTEVEIRQLFGNHPNVSMIWLASERSGNPVPGLLGLADRIYCTEDSISMVSEALTAGKPVTLLKTMYMKGPKERLKKWGIRLGLISKRSAWKPDKFKSLYDEFREKGWLCSPGEEEGSCKSFEFGEAQRAAKWILSQWR